MPSTFSTTESQSTSSPPETVDVPLSDLFVSDWPMVEVGELLPTARDHLQAIRDSGRKIRITGDILLTVFGTQATLARLLEHDLPFDELEQKQHADAS